MTIAWTKTAQTERESAVLWLAERNASAALVMVEALDAALRALEAREFEGREVQLSNGRKARRWPVGSMVIYYRRERELLVVLRVFDARRKPIER